MKRYLFRLLVFSLVIALLFGIFQAGSYICCLTQKQFSEYQIPIIMYHHILKDESRHGDFIISPDDFEKDLKYIKKEGFTTITDLDLIAYQEKGTPLPEKPIMLTFDDGHLSYFEYVVPLLEKYEMKAIVSVVGSYTNDYTENPDKSVSYAYLSWNEIAELSKSTHTRIANHTYDMHKISANRKGCAKASGESKEHHRKIFTEDVKKMQSLIYENTKINADCFTYPFGSYCAETEEELKKSGFKMSLSCNEGINNVSKTSSLFKLKRYNRPHKKSVEQILKELKPLLA